MAQTPIQAATGIPGERWRARRFASWSLRAAIFLAPLVAAVLASLWLSTQLPEAETPLGVIAWWLTLIAVSSAVAWAVDRLGRRLLPLTVMLRMTMLFPDRAPSRFKVALRSSNVSELRRRVAAANGGKATDLSSSAELILSLASALNNHDRRTRGHGERTRAYTDMLADELRIPEEGRDKLRWAALLHDIGKLEVPADILNKSGRLDDTEMAVVKRHPLMGMKVAAPIVPWLGQWAGAIEHHHEWWDGTGYPGGLSGGEISLAARIVAVADAYDVMTSGRVYQAAKRPDEARREVASMAGTQFDPLVARALLNVSLGKLRWALGPMAVLGNIPFMFDRIGRDLATLGTAATVTAAAAFTGIVAAPALVPDDPPAVTAQSEGIVGGPQDNGDGGSESGQVPGGDGGDVFSDTTSTSTTSSSTSTTSTSSTLPSNPVVAPPSSTTSTTSPATTSTTSTSTTVPPTTTTTAPTPNPTTTTTPPSTTTTTSPPTTTTTTPPTTTTLPPPTTTTTMPPPPPVLVDDEAVTEEDGLVDIPVLANDEGGSQIESITPPTNGSAEPAGEEGQAIRYAPTAEWSGTDTFTYTACTSPDECGTATVTVQVSPVNDSPAPAPDGFSTGEDTPIVDIDVLANDADIDGDTLIIGGVSLPAKGTATTAGTTVTYIPDPDTNGTDTFSYQACDPSDACTDAAVTVTVIPVNDPPVATDDAAVTNEDTPVVIDLVANVTDVDSDQLAVEVLAPPANGTATPDGTSIQYTPNPDFNGPDSVTYEVCDPNGECDTAAVTVEVSPVNDPPVAANDTATTDEDIPTTIEVLGNDTDVDGDELAIEVVTPPTNGAATPDGTTITYTPNPDANGTDTFTYQACDPTSACTDAAVTVTVSPVNDPPVAADDTATTDEDSPTTIEVLANDSNPDGEQLTITIADPPTNGTATPDGTSIQYTPNPDFSGADTFTYSLCDPSGECDTAAVTVTVEPAPEPPLAVDDFSNAFLGIIAVIDVLENDTGDFDPDSLVIVDQPSTGAAWVSDDRIFYLNLSFNGEETVAFPYQICDSTGLTCDTATVTVRLRD